jgi:hypothetical protein
VFLWIVFVPLLFFKKSRPLAGTLYICTACVTHLNWWLFSFVVTYKTLGGFWLVIGLLFAGMGVLPLAFVGEMIRGMWWAVPWLVATVAMALGPYCFGTWLRGPREKEGSQREVTR